MKLNLDSPELTAYALGELPPDEMARVEAALAADPSLVAEVEAVRVAAAGLSRAFVAEARIELLPEQRDRIERAAVGESPATDPGEFRLDTSRPKCWEGWMPWRHAWGWALAGGAAVALAVYLVPTRVAESRVTRTEAEVESAGYRYAHPDPANNIATPTARALQTPVVNPRPVNAPDAPVPKITVSKVLVSPPAVDSVQARMPVSSDGLARPVRPSGSPGSVNPPVDAAPGERAIQTSPAAPQRQASVAVSNGEGARGRRLNPRGAVPPNGVEEPLAQKVTPSEKTPTSLDPVLMARYGLPPRAGAASREAYRAIVENPFRSVLETPLSTFGLDVDTASYANVRRFLREGALPPPDAVRIEELVNYFHYESPSVADEHPVSIRVEVADAPWKPGNRLARVTVKARDVARAERPRANLVFLVDVSGSMEPEPRLPLVRRTLRLLVQRLTARDRVGIVTYAGDAAVALPSSNGAEKEPILAAIDRLHAGGSTHGSAGIRSAYAMARANFAKDAVNRVILCTDGDFNVGATSQEELLALVQEEARSGVFLTVLGYGMDNLQDRTMQLLADNGNGNHAYIDSFREAQKVMGEQLESTLVTVAKDAKLQIEFNPERVRQWRLLGYEKRALADRDFNDDAKDAGDLGAGHLVTALYELVPVAGSGPGVDPLRYGAGVPVPANKSARPDELFFAKLRYKLPDGDTSRLIQLAVKDDARDWKQAGTDFRFAAAVAGFGMLLRDSAHRGELTYDQVMRMAEQGLGEDREGYRAEFVDLVRRAKALSGK